MKLTPARFIQAYNALGIRFTLQAGVVVSVGGSPVFAEWVRAHSAWLRPVIEEHHTSRVQSINQATCTGVAGNKQKSNEEYQARATHADRLVWDGIQNARRAEAKVKAIRGRR